MFIVNGKLLGRVYYGNAGTVIKPTLTGIWIQKMSTVPMIKDADGNLIKWHEASPVIRANADSGHFNVECEKSYFLKYEWLEMVTAPDGSMYAGNQFGCKTLLELVEKHTTQVYQENFIGNDGVNYGTLEMVVSIIEWNLNWVTTVKSFKKEWNK